MPVELLELVTEDPELAHTTMADLYSGGRVTTLSSAARIEFAMCVARAGPLDSGRLRHSAATRSVVPPFDAFMAATVLGGRARRVSGREDRRLGRGDVLLYPTTAASTSTWADLDLVLVRVPLAAVEQAARDRAGSAAARLRFESTAPVSPAAAAHWRALTAFVHQSLTARETVPTSLAQQRMADLLAATALDVFPNTTMGQAYRPGPGSAGPATLRRAVAYIDAHAAEPVGVADVAAHAGVGVRALQDAFRRHLGTTPSGYLRRVRLEAAHRDLQAADPTDGDTVAGVAARWGFSPGSRFAGFYREQFGVPPGHSLRT
ncbi:AraC family transcriptional regulator [Trujillonella humicola]|uniref:AraC family transcriptional regulator n=1 Tax=Trujillonella humicola TaxID=3383699 RepID=UPI0039058500